MPQPKKLSAKLANVQTPLSPVGRTIACPLCSWRSTLPRRNGAWMRLKGALRKHAEEKHAEFLAAEAEKEAPRG